MAAAADSAAVDKLFEGGLLLIWSYAHTGVLSKYRKEFPIGTSFLFCHNNMAGRCGCLLTSPTYSSELLPKGTFFASKNL